MAFHDFSLEPISSLSSSNFFDFDSENRLSPNYAPTYTPLSAAQTFATPPRSFGRDITNAPFGQFLCDGSYLTEADIGQCQYPFNNATLVPLCQVNRLPTLTSCLYGTTPPSNSFSLENIIDSPSSSNPESNFSFTEPSLFQIESNLFDDSDESYSSLTSLNVDDSFSKFINDDNQNYFNVKVEEPDTCTSIVKLENYDFETNMAIADCSQPMGAKHDQFYINQSFDEDRIKNRKIFPFRLWDLASDENFEPLSWNPDGTMLVVNMQSIHRHLMKICRTKKFASFLRQLHLYGFRKDARCLPNKRSSSKISYYQHQYFVRNDPDLLYKINRVKLN